MASGFDSALQEALDREIAKHRVAGAAVGVVHAGRVTIATSGFADRSTREPVTAGTPFLIGSIAKTWTATIVMRLLHERNVDLDEPVRAHVPELALASEQATAAVTLRHLLTHSGGIDEDTTIAEQARSDRCLEAYMANLATIGQLHEPGALFSYSNSGFVLLGLVAERLGAMRFEELVSGCIIEPLALDDSAPAVGGGPGSRNGPHRVAAGYRLGWRGQHVLVRDHLPRAYGPAGSTVAASVADVLRFAQVHLDEATDAARSVLPPSARNEMRQPQRLLPWASTVEEGSVGLGWMRTRVGPHDVLYHGGGNLGQQCGLVVVPSANLALTTLTNAHSCPGLHAAVIDLVLAERLGTGAQFAPTRTHCGDPTVDPAVCVGEYRRRSLAVRVTDVGGALRYRVVGRSRDLRLGTGESGMTATLQRLFSAGLEPCRDNVFVTPSGPSAGSTGTPWVFSQSNGEPSAGHLTIGYSALRRVDP